MVSLRTFNAITLVILLLPGGGSAQADPILIGTVPNWTPGSDVGSILVNWQRRPVQFLRGSRGPRTEGRLRPRLTICP